MLVNLLLHPPPAVAFEQVPMHVGLMHCIVAAHLPPATSPCASAGASRSSIDSSAPSWFLVICHAIALLLRVVVRDTTTLRRPGRSAHRAGPPQLCRPPALRFRLVRPLELEQWHRGTLRTVELCGQQGEPHMSLVQAERCRRIAGELVVRRRRARRVRRRGTATARRRCSGTDSEPRTTDPRFRSRGR